MEFENYAERTQPLVEFDTYQKQRADFKEVVRISVKKGEMTTHKIRKTKFSQLNDKRFYFPDSILSLPYGHPSLKGLKSTKKARDSR